MPASASTTFHPIQWDDVVCTHQRHLPHWRQPDATYFITFRLADSLPAHLAGQWREELDIWLRHHPQPWNGKTIAEYEIRFANKREEWFDQGHGSCVLREKNLAAAVEETLRHFDGTRYVLDAFVIMPNHVHVLARPLTGHDLTDILHTWKSYSAKAINKLLGRTGTLWMDESHDHIVRDAAELERYREYIAMNPVKPNLCDGEFVMWRGDVLKPDVGRAASLSVSQAARLRPETSTGKLPVTQTGEPPVLQFPLCEIKDHEGWRKLPGEMVYEGPYVQIEECSFLTPARPDKPTPWTVAHRKSAVAVAPITEDGKFILIQQERLPLRRTLWEFPAGQIDDEHTRESIVATALRELDEEAGCELAPHGELIPLGWFFGSQGFTAEHVYLFVARQVRIMRAPQPVGGEHIGEVRAVSPAELREMISNNTLQDALTLALFARMCAKGIV